MTKKKQEDFDYFKEFQAQMDEKDAGGFEDLNTDTMAIPFIRILQDLSPQVKKKHADYVEDAEPGLIFNSVTKQLYTAPLRFIVGKFERYYIEWKPNRGAFVASHLPETVENEMANELLRDENNKLYHKETKNNFVDTYIYYILLPDHLEEGVCILAMSSTQIKEAKKLNRMMATTRIPGTSKKAMPYFIIWSMDVIETSNDKGSWYTPKISMESFVTQELLGTVVEERKALPQKTLDLSQLTNDAGKGANSDESDPGF